MTEPTVPEQVYRDAARAVGVVGERFLERVVGPNWWMAPAVESAYRAGQEAPVRVVVVVNWRKQTVHGVTCSNTEAQVWVRKIVEENSGDRLAASMTVDVIRAQP